jgi:hypothetical protein
MPIRAPAAAGKIAAGTTPTLALIVVSGPTAAEATGPPAPSARPFGATDGDVHALDKRPRHSTSGERLGVAQG